MIRTNSQIDVNGLRCLIVGHPSEPFYSLVDYRNSFLTSNDVNKIIEFYCSLNDREELIQWMKERPKGVSYIREVEGDKNIVVVIPTADYNGKYAKNCRENIFKGLHIVFVESGGRGDFYFNYAHNCNIGIRKAMEHNPKWIVLSNDDMYKIDGLGILKGGLSKVDNEKIKIVFTKYSRYHSYPSCVGRKRYILGELGYFVYNLIHGNLKTYSLFSRISRKYKIGYTLGPRNRLMSKIFLRESLPFIMTGSFHILSGKFITEVNEKLFDEGYINVVEDWESSINASFLKDAVGFVDYRIGDYIGGTMGMSQARSIRDVANLVYFNHRLPAVLSKATDS